MIAHCMNGQPKKLKHYSSADRASMNRKADDSMVVICGKNAWVVNKDIPDYIGKWSKPHGGILMKEAAWAGFYSEYPEHNGKGLFSKTEAKALSDRKAYLESING